MIAAVECLKVSIREGLVWPKLLEAGDLCLGHAELPWWKSSSKGGARNEQAKENDESGGEWHKHLTRQNSATAGGGEHRLQ